MKPYGIGSLPSASWRGVRGREIGLLQVARPVATAALTRSIDEKTKAAAREFFSPAFRVEAPGYGIAPLPNQGSPVAAMGAQSGAISGLGAWYNPFTWGEEKATCNGIGWDEVRGLRNQIKFRLDRVTPGIKVTCESILKQTDEYATMPMCQRIDMLQQALSAAINDIRAQEGRSAKPHVDLGLPSNVKAEQVTPDSVPDAGFLPMVFPNEWSNTARYAVTAGVAALAVGLVTGVIAFGGRK